VERAQIEVVVVDSVAEEDGVDLDSEIWALQIKS